MVDLHLPHPVRLRGRPHRRHRVLDQRHVQHPGVHVREEVVRVRPVPRVARRDRVDVRRQRGGTDGRRPGRPRRGVGRRFRHRRSRRRDRRRRIIPAAERRESERRQHQHQNDVVESLHGSVLSLSCSVVPSGFARSRHRPRSARKMRRSRGRSDPGGCRHALRVAGVAGCRGRAIERIACCAAARRRAVFGRDDRRSCCRAAGLIERLTVRSGGIAVETGRSPGGGGDERDARVPSRSPPPAGRDDRRRRMLFVSIPPSRGRIPRCA